MQTETQIPDTTKHFVDAAGKYIGHRHVGRIEVRDTDANLIVTRPFDDGPPPAGATEVPTPPKHATDRWDGTKWIVGDRPEFEPSDPEVAVELLRRADPAAFVAARQLIIDARKAAAEDA